MVLLGVSVASQGLHGPVNGLGGVFHGYGLGHVGHGPDLPVVSSVIEEPSRLVGQELGAHQAGIGLGYGMLEGLVAADGIGKDLPLVTVLHGVLDGQFSYGRGGNGEDQPFGIQDVQEGMPPFVHLSQDGAFGYPEILYHHFAGLGVVDAVLGNGAHLDGVIGQVHQEKGDAVGSGRGVLYLGGSCDEEHSFGPVGTADEHLGAVDAVAVAIFLGKSFCTEGIGTGVGLCEGHAELQLPFGYAGKVLFLLLFGAVPHNGVGAKNLC